jgi:hypothetical protein
VKEEYRRERHIKAIGKGIEECGAPDYCIFDAASIKPPKKEKEKKKKVGKGRQ